MGELVYALGQQVSFAHGKVEHKQAYTKQLQHTFALHAKLTHPRILLFLHLGIRSITISASCAWLWLDSRLSAASSAHVVVVSLSRTVPRPALSLSYPCTCMFVLLSWSLPLSHRSLGHTHTSALSFWVMRPGPAPSCN